MASLADIFAEVKLDLTKQEESKLKRRIGSIDTRREGAQVATRFGVGFNGAFGGIASKSAGLFAAGFAAVKGLQVFGGFINDARESAKISRITENAIRATGGAAKITAAQVGDLATAISNKTGIDDEQVQTAANMLLTFKAVRNETGRGNDVFNRATQAAADLSVQFGGIDGASKQLGKALNDPIKGTAALSKAGVTFTAQQKEQIKTLVESGNTLGAQKIILKEVEGQVGGAAAAAADPLERLKVVGGNLAETIGGFLLPSVNKFANFATNTLVPGVEALFAAFQEGDVTSDGFVGVMERIGVAARGAFGFFKSEVLPRLREFGGFLVGTAVPAVAGFGRNLVTTLAPAARDVFGFFKSEVLPRLRDFAGFLGGSVLPKVGQLATSLSKNKDFLVPFVGTIVAVVGALKTWAVIQGILNVVLAANPIGLVVLAIAALAGGLVYAYKHSDQFRKVVDTAFRVAAAAGKFMWEAVLKPLLGFMAATFKFVWERAQFWSKVVVGAFNAIKGPAVTVFRFLVGKMLDFIGNMLNAAAKAFGWVPKLGGPLKNAATEFQKFRTSVNKSLDQINDEPVDIKVGLAYTQALGQRTKQMKFARGGMMPGYTPGRDVHRFFSATGGILDLSGGEPVLRPEAGAVLGKGWVDGVNGAARNGGQGGVRRFLGGFASGGLLPRALLPSGKRLSALASTVSGSVDSVATRVAQAIAKQLVAGRVNPGLNGALGFARSQVGKPYVWGGVGPGGYDCSGFMSAITNAILGRPLHRRLFATGSFPTSMFARGMGAFSIGSFRGNPGHMAGTLNGVNVESRGGRGVVVGNGARGAQNSLFGGNVWHLKRFRRGGIIGDLPYDLLKNRRDLREELGLQVFDQGGSWRSGTLGINTSGKTETVVPGGGAVELGPETIRALVKGWAAALAGGKFRVVGGQGGSYVLQMTNG